MLRSINIIIVTVLLQKIITKRIMRLFNKLYNIGSVIAVYSKKV